MTKTTGNFTDFLDFSRSTGGTSLRRIALGEEQLTTTTVSFDGTQADFDTIGLGFAPTAGTLYQVIVDATAGTSGRIQINTNGDDTGYVLAGTKMIISLDNMYLTTASSVQAQSHGGANKYVGSATFSVKEVTLDAPSGDLVLFNHPNNVPRVEYDTNGNVKGLLIEESRTNLVTLGEVTATSGQGWADSSSVSTNLSENALGMFQGVSIASSGQDWHRISTNITVTSGTDYAATVFYRAGTSNRLRIVLRDSNGETESRVTNAIGSLAVTATAAGTVSILSEEDLPDNVKKITIKYTPNFSGNLGFGFGPDSNTSGETVIAYAAQFEAGPFATSYIPTFRATATRNADVCNIDVDSFGWHGGEAGSGTVVFEAQSDNWEHMASNVYTRVLEFDGHNNNGIYRAAADGDGDQFRYRLSDSSDGGAFGPTNIGAATASITDGAKVALAYAPDDFAIAANGASPTTDTSGTFDTLAVTKISIGKSTGNSNFLNGYLKSFQYYPRRLTNAQLQELTS